MKTRYVVDTVALVSYFSEILEANEIRSRSWGKIIRSAFQDYAYTKTLLIIPSVVFLEIFGIWFKEERVTNEFRAMFLAEIYRPISECENIEIREVDKEALEVFLELDDPTINLENRDRLILATAILLEAQLLTSDPKIIDYVNSHDVKCTIIQ